MHHLNGVVNVLDGLHINALRVQAEVQTGLLRGQAEQVGAGGSRITQDQQPRNPGTTVLSSSTPLTVIATFPRLTPVTLPPGRGQALDQPLSHGIADINHYDG